MSVFHVESFLLGLVTGAGTMFAVYIIGDFFSTGEGDE
jgi:hypothetical protein